MSNSDSRGRSKIFDWELEKRRRRDTLVDGMVPSDVREILQDEQPIQLRPASVPASTHFSFRLGALRLAVPLSEVLAVIPACETCLSLGAREFFRESISFRSRAVTLADVAGLFGFRERAGDDVPQEIVILEFLGRLVGIRADEALGPCFADDSALVREGLKQASRYARGFTPDLVLLLDIPRLIAAAHGGR